MTTYDRMAMGENIVVQRRDRVLSFRARVADVRRGIPVGKFIRENWGELIIMVLLVGLVWFAWDSQTRLTRQETRTEQIVAALPDLRTRVAFETVNSPFRSAVIVSKPKQEGDKWRTTIQLVDPASGLVTTYEKDVESKDIRKLNSQVVGTVMSVDRTAVNFREMRSMAKELKEPAFTPDSVDEDASYITYATPERVKSALDAFDLQVVGVKPLPDVKTWPGLTEAMGAGSLAIDSGNAPSR